MAEHQRLLEQRHARRPMGTDRVPVLPPGVPYLLSALHDDSLSFPDIARAIEHVPSVGARLLALANSAWSAPLSPITSIEAACGRLGMRVVRTASLALAVSQPFNPARCPAFDGTTFWCSTLLNAEAAAWIAQHAWRDDMATARTAGLLGNLGLVWLAESLPVQTGAALEEARNAPAGHLNQRLHAACGLGYDEAGALLAEAWRLPASLRDAIADQFRDDADAAPLSRVVRGASQMVGCVRRGEDWAQPDPILNGLGLDMPSQLGGMRYLEAMRLQTEELAAALFCGH